MRLVLVALGVVFAIAAIGATIGFISSALGGQGPESAGDWLGVGVILLVLYGLAGGLLYVAHRLGLRERRRQLATEQQRAGDEPAVFECPECQDTNLVRGPSRARWHGIGWVYVARCLTCGWRSACAKDVWSQLPESALGDPYQRVADIRDHVLRDPMSRGQTAICVAGFLVAFVAAVWLVDVPPRNWLGGALTGTLAVGIVSGAWWLGRWLFPPAGKPRARCSNCGYDLRGLAEPRCPECGTEFDSKLLPSQSHGVSGDGKDEESSLG